MKIQYSQIQQIFSLLPADLKNDEELRKDFISDFTEGRTGSTKDLTTDEANSLIGSLKGDYAHFARFDKNNKQHLAVLNICYDLGWTVFNPKLNRSVADLKRLGTFIAGNKSPVRKPMMEMTAKECSKLIFVLERIVKYNYNKEKE